MFRIAEQQQHGQRGHAQHHVDDRNVQLAAGTGRVTDLQMRHPVEAGGSETMVNAPVISAWEAMMPAVTDSTTAT